MTKLFETTSIKSLTLPNRYVRSATWTGIANPTDGSPSPLLIDKMVKPAQGGVGLIIPGMALIEKEDSSGMRQLGAYGDDLVPGLSSMTEAVHKAGGKIAMQIVHPGLQAPLMGWPRAQFVSVLPSRKIIIKKQSYDFTIPSEGL